MATLDNEHLETNQIPPQMFGHPKGLFYLFFAELWERFSFYGMRALLTLYMTNELYKALVNKDDVALGIYAAYGSLVYATPIFGGMIADKFIGYRNSIVLGGVLMAIGHFLMAFEYDIAFFGALGLLIVGNGFFKPNISTIVGSLYNKNDPRRDAGFTIFYMGINIGAWMAPLLCGWLGREYGWHYGFGAAGVGMVLGLVIFIIGGRTGVFMDKGLQPEEYRNKKVAGTNVLNWVIAGAFLVVPLLALLVRFNNLQVMGDDLHHQLMWVILAGILVFVFYLSFQFSKKEVGQMWSIMLITFFLTFFWAFFEQGGGSLTLFAERNVNLGLGLDAAQANSINPFFIIALAIPFSAIWVWLAKLRANPITPVKVALGIAQLGLGFLIFAYGAQFVDDEARIPFIFLVLGYFFLTTGELFLSPIGLSKVTELAPFKYAAFFMGIFFLSSTFGHTLAGEIGKMTSTSDGVGTGIEFFDNIAERVTGLDRDSERLMGGPAEIVRPEIEGDTLKTEVGDMKPIITKTDEDAEVGVGETETANPFRQLFNYASVYTMVAIISLFLAIFALIITPFWKRMMADVH